jgi:hypothetical protein
MMDRIGWVLGGSASGVWADSSRSMGSVGASERWDGPWVASGRPARCVALLAFHHRPIIASTFAVGMRCSLHFRYGSPLI